MKFKKQLSIVISVLLQTATAFTSSTFNSRPDIVALAVASQQSKQPLYTILHYRNYKDIYQEINTVDVHRTSSLQFILDTAATTPLRKEASIDSTKSRAVSSPIISLHNIQDYQRHVINKPEHICIIHFTDRYNCNELEEYKQMARALTRNRNKNNECDNNRMKIKFFSVHIDEKDDDTAVLKDMLQIKHMPQGVIHHPRQAIFLKKTSSLRILREYLERLDDTTTI
jgi:hypothetical protein